jgi:hypothetical protein
MSHTAHPNAFDYATKAVRGVANYRHLLLCVVNMPASTAALSVLDRSCNASPADFRMPSDSDSDDNTEGVWTNCPTIAKN